MQTSRNIKSSNLLGIAKRIYNYSPPLYINQDGIEAVASSLLLKWRTNHFLITAGHVMDDYKDRIGIFTNNMFIELAGENVWSKRAKNKLHDRIDIGAYKLNSSFLNLLGNAYAFFDIGTFDVDAVDSLEDDYLVVGQPVRRVKMKTKDRKIVLSPFIFNSSLNNSESTYKYTDTRSDVNFLMEYRRRKIQNPFSNDIVQGPTPNGISGAGVWHFSDPLTDNIDTIRYYPCGIIIEYWEKRSVFVGTRIKIITELLRQNFDKTIPPSKTVIVNTHLTNDVY